MFKQLGSFGRQIAFLFVAVLVLALPVSRVMAAPPTRVPLGPGSFTISGVCAFDVQFTTTTAKEYPTTFTDQNGNVTMQNVTGASKVTLTNMTSGTSLDLNASGPVHLTYYSDGSSQFKGTGEGISWGPLNSVLNLPALAYTDGPTTILADSQGFIHSATFHGRATDLCAALGQ